MKLNFSFHFRQLMCGTFILFPIVLILCLLLPDDEWYDSLLGIEGEFIAIWVFLLLFLSYSIGLLMETFYSQLFDKSKATAHFEHFLDVFPVAKDSIISKTNVYCQRNGIEKTCLSVADAYRYMYSFIILKSENLSKEVQSIIGSVHILKSICISFVLLIILMLGMAIKEGYSTEEMLSYLTIVLILVVLVVYLFRLYRKKQIKILDAIARNYYLLCKHTPSPYSPKETEPKVDVEVG